MKHTDQFESCAAGEPARTVSIVVPPIKIVACPGLGDRHNNPYTWLTHEPMLRLGGAVSEFSFYRSPAPDTDILHIHWPERIFWGRVSRLHPWLSEAYAQRMLAMMDRVRKRGGSVVWTAHNIAPHASLDAARRALWTRYIDAFLSRVDLIISLSQQADDELVKAYPRLLDTRRTTIAHPHYRTAYPPPLTRTEARARLDLPQQAYVLLAAGTIRPNKGIPTLAHSFAGVAQPDEVLLIAGSCDDEAERRELEAISESHPSVIVRFGRIPDSDIGSVISAADLSIFNFQTILNSGSVLLSLSFDTPVVAPRLGSLNELADLGPQWFTPLTQPMTNAALRATIDQARAARILRGCTAPIESLDPDVIAARIYAEYAALLDNRRRN